MKQSFQPGDRKVYEKVVDASETASFQQEDVHPVYATFALARDAEWACRLFVHEMKESDEEGIGTMVSVHHHSPAKIGQKVRFEATVSSIERNEIICTYRAYVDDHLIAEGEQGQKILKKEKLTQLFENL
ncbi:MAG: hypothetical protein BRD50_00620 [Bacteroidetes bacterium SW_11_45_7]|nr:MAG: hypothetical protein BRD50_00620 [Bacteroidetes bacterium SW_11_45_7]